MALIWYDGFDYIQATGADQSTLLETLGYWNNSGFAPLAGGRFGGNCLGLVGNPLNAKAVTKIFSASYGAGFLGMAVSAGIGASFSFFDTSGAADQIYFTLQNYGVVSAYLGRRHAARRQRAQ